MRSRCHAVETSEKIAMSVLSQRDHASRLFQETHRSQNSFVRMAGIADAHGASIKRRQFA
jgi:hypothetical protein